MGSPPLPPDVLADVRGSQRAPDPEHDGGAFGRSWRLLVASASLVRRDPAARRLFACGALLTVLASLALYAPGALWAREEGAIWPLMVVVAVTAWPLSFLSIACNVAVLHVVARRLAGEPAQVADGLRAVRARLGQIALWSLLTTGVGLVLDVVAERVPFGGRVLSWLVGTAWSLATLFAVPILALDGCAPRECLSRSAAAFRARWGEGVAGTVSIFVCLLVATIPASMVLGAGVSFGGDDAGSVAAIVLGFTVLLLCSVVAGTMRHLFALALWRDEGLPGFHPADLEAGLKLRPRGRRPWSRRRA